MINYILKFKDRETPSNLCITTVKAVVDDCYVVEIWDVFREYHSLKPLEDNIRSAEAELKTCTDERRIEYLKSMISWRKYSNKRNLVPKEDFYKDFEVTSAVYLDKRVENAGCYYWPHYKDQKMAKEVADQMKGCSLLRINCV